MASKSHQTSGAHAVRSLQLCIFHYHLLPGGVTDVIMGWLRILAQYPRVIFPEYDDIKLLVCCGKPDNVSELSRQWRDFMATLPEPAQGPTLELEFLVDRELDYRSLSDSQVSAELNPEQQGQSWLAYVESQAVHLLQQYCARGRDTLWWLHNFHLGKNIAFSQALQLLLQQVPLGLASGLASGLDLELDLGLLERAKGLKFLLQIHDFPECGRFELYRELLQSQQWLDIAGRVVGKGTATACLYPQGEHICYATINRRDYQILLEAGLPAENLYFLPNPLEFRELGIPHEPASGKESLRAEFARDFGLEREGEVTARLALYPVRCIRRKNVLELGVLNILAGEPWNLVCTLPGRSEAERPYSDLVESLFAEGIIKGRCHIGLELNSKGWDFDKLCAAADLIVSSSVLEGFGYTYFNPMYWGKKLLARKLDVLQGFEECFEPDLAEFYSELKIPLYFENGENRVVDFELLTCYQSLRQSYMSYVAGLPEAMADELGNNLQRLLPEEPPQSVDFALWTVGQQKQILERLCREQRLAADAQGQGGQTLLLAACREANSALLQALSVPESQTVALATRRSRERLLAEFAPQRLAAILRQACASVLESTSEAKCQFDSQLARECSRKVLSAFSQLDYHCALFWERSWLDWAAEQNKYD